jgi:hypothetical protein
MLIVRGVEETRRNELTLPCPIRTAIVFRRRRQPETAMTILSACFSTLLCTFLPLLLENRRGQAHRSAMSDDVSSVRIRPGRIRDRGRGARPRAQSFMSQVLRAAAKANEGRRPRPSCAGPAAAAARRARDAAPALGAARRSPTRSSARQQRDEGPGSAGSSSRLVSSATNSAQALPGHIFATSSGTAPPAMAGGVSSMAATPITPTAVPSSSAGTRTATRSDSSSRPKTAIAWPICAASPET